MASDRTLIQIRERSFLETLDLALVVIRHRPVTLGLAAAAGIAPLALANAWMFANLELSEVAWLPILFMEAPWATLPLTVCLGGMMFGQRLRAGAVAWRIFASLPALVLSHVVIRGLLGLTGLLIPLIPERFWFASEVILLERAGPFRALRRCWRLSETRSGQSFLQWLGQLGFGAAFAICFWVGTGAVSSALFQSEVTWEPPLASSWSGPRFQAGLWIAVGFFGVARFLTYIDQRIRSEGWELRLQLQGAGRDLEKGMP